MSGCSGCAYKGMSTAVEDTYVGVRFREETNATLCATGGEIYPKGDWVVVDLDNGPAFGHVEMSPMPVFKPCQKSSAKRILRRAVDADRHDNQRQMANEAAGKLFCQQRAKQLNLEMKVSRVDFALNSREAVFYFTSEGRIDFRQLVRDLSSRFSARVKMVQVGARDEAGLLGGMGVCGRTLCCSTWLKDFKPISISMAKRQNLSLNPSKISGQCGRLLCCLAYEDDNYRKAKPAEVRVAEAPSGAAPPVEARPERGSAAMDVAS
jgi:cell fate regulator YaaT (PSP1 superfamily)